MDSILSVVSMREQTWWRSLRKENLDWLSRVGKRLIVHGEIAETPAQVISTLEKYFAQHPGYAKYFKLLSGPDGKPETQELKRLASKRVIVYLFPAFR